MEEANDFIENVDVAISSIQNNDVENKDTIRDEFTPENPEITQIQRPRVELTDDEMIKQIDEMKAKKLEEEKLFMHLEMIKRSQFKKNEDEILYAVCVEGSRHSDFAFEIVTNYFLKNNKLLLTYIYNDNQDEIYNYNNKKQTIINKYYDKLLSFELSSLFYFEDKLNVYHTLEQNHKISIQYKADYLFLGFEGLKGPRGDTKELTKGLNYLLGNSKIPVIMIEENLWKNRKEKDSFNWLFIFDRQSSYCHKIIKLFFPLINNETDTIYGHTLLPGHINYDDVEKEFKSEANIAGIKNVNYELSNYYEKIEIKEFIDKLNFGHVSYDFVVFYNNSEKYKLKNENSYTFSFASKIKANICFSN